MCIKSSIARSTVSISWLLFLFCSRGRCAMCQPQAPVSLYKYPSGVTSCHLKFTLRASSEPPAWTSSWGFGLHILQPWDRLQLKRQHSSIVVGSQPSVAVLSVWKVVGIENKKPYIRNFMRSTWDYWHHITCHQDSKASSMLDPGRTFSTDSNSVIERRRSEVVDACTSANPPT